MHRVYIGNLDSRVTEDGLRQLLDELRLSFRSVVVKRSYAFVDCSDQENFEQALEKLNGLYFYGANLLVEPAAISKRIRGNDIVVCNLPPDSDESELRRFLEAFGPITNFNATPDEEFTTANVVYEHADDAKKALTQLNGAEYKGRILKAEYYDARTSIAIVPRPRHHEYPLRMLVPSEYIGAVIGRRGQTIKRITNNCAVKVDVHGKENTGFLEKLVSIYGAPESCTEACRMIMSIVQQSATSAGTSEVPLKLLVDDLYCGRIIGRDGRGVKKVREDTGSRIAISNVQEMAILYPDRVISIRGSLDSVSQAEAAISEKLRDCYKKEESYYSRTAASLGMPSTSTGQFASLPAQPHSSPPSSPPPTSRHRYEAATSEATAATTISRRATAAPTTLTSPTSSASTPGAVAELLSSPVHYQQQSVCQVAIPNFAVGAIIGAGGINIKRIIRDSNALVTVEPKRDDQSLSDERLATIKGTPDSCWRASYFIFEKMKQEGFAGTDGEVRLRTIIAIPRSAAGRVVGKGGKSVREIQRITGAMVKLAADVRREQPQFQEMAGAEGAVGGVTETGEEPGSEDSVTVEIFGNFIATQSAQSRIRSIASKVSASTSQASQPQSPDAPTSSTS